MDHYRHLQWGYLADELAVCRAQISALQAELKAQKIGLDQARSAERQADSGGVSSLECELLIY